MLQRPGNPDGVEKGGYIDVKFPGNIKGKRGWCRRWVLIVKLRVESFSKRRCLAKVDIYPDEASWRKGTKQADRRILENVTCIRRTPSSTHKFAFHVDGEAPLSLACQNETETQDWIRELRAIFLPKMRRKYDDAMFEVSVIDNCSSAKLGLNADYLMSIEATHIHLIPTSEQQKFYQWEFSEIPFFELTTGVPAADKEKILEIDYRYSPSDKQSVGIYMFYSRNAREILGLIRMRLDALLESPYSHIEHQSDEEQVSSSDEDCEFKYDNVRQMGTCVSNVPTGTSHSTPKRSPTILPTVRSHMSPMLPVPATRPSALRLMKLEDRPTSYSSDASRDSGITSPTAEHPDNPRGSDGRHDWIHHDSVDSGTTDLDIEDHNYDDIPFQLDQFGNVETQSNSQEEATVLSTFTRSRIQSEPDLKRFHNNSSKRMAMSVPHRRSLRRPLPLPERNKDIETEQCPFNKTYELAWHENQIFRSESPDDTTFQVGSPDDSDENHYAFHNNCEYLQKCADRISFLSDISERSRQDSISVMIEPECEKNSGLEEPSSRLDPPGCVYNEDSGYLDMSGRSFSAGRARTPADKGTSIFKVEEAETDCTYVSMARPFEKRLPLYENLPFY